MVASLPYDTGRGALGALVRQEEASLVPGLCSDNTCVFMSCRRHYH